MIDTERVAIIFGIGSVAVTRSGLSASAFNDIFGAFRFRERLCGGQRCEKESNKANGCGKLHGDNLEMWKIGWEEEEEETMIR